MAPTNKKYYRAKAFIFDLEGTLVDTIPLVKRLWHQFAADHGLDEDKISVIKTEQESFCILPGISTLLQKIPYGKWAVCCTENMDTIARRKLKLCGIAVPTVMTSLEMVLSNKPNPECYTRTIRELGFKPEEVIVFEDTPAGVKAAHDAGAKVIACLTTHTIDTLLDAGAHSIVKLLTDVDFTNLSDGTFEVEVKYVLQ